VLHFSLNKAATQYVKNILRTIAAENNLTPVGMNEWAFGSHMPYVDHLSAADMQAYKHVFKPQGYLYSVFGGFVEGIDRMEDYKVILMVRDPRDILVSQFYSTAYSHPLPGEASDKRDAFLQKREAARILGIDAFVLQEAPRLKAYLDRYQSELLARYPHTVMLRYEDMIADFSRFLDQLCSAAGCRISPATRQNLLAAHDAQQPKQEDVQKHVRKGVAGDYRNKLKSDTIARLSDLMLLNGALLGYKAESLLKV
jgi:hypothetical protein